MEDSQMETTNTHGVTFTDSGLPNVVELRNVSQTYDGGKSWILERCNFLIEDKPDQGQFVVILGLSGCGKSTLLRYIAGLQEPTSGEVLIHGKPRTKDDVISKVFQQYSSFEFRNVIDNVALPLELKGVRRKEREERAMEMIRKVGLDGHEHKWAQHGLLSGGQLQRVAIARSLISNPGIILMDEPFGALDGVTRYQMQMLLAGLWLEMQSTVVFVTHDIHEAVFLGDDIYIMSPAHGCIVDHIGVDLPLQREKSITHTPRFLALVAAVDDALQRTAEAAVEE